MQLQSLFLNLYYEEGGENSCRVLSWNLLGSCLILVGSLRRGLWIIAPGVKKYYAAFRELASSHFKQAKDVYLYFSENVG